MRPMHKGAKGVLMAVDVEGAVKLDVRAPNHHKVMIGAGQYQDGNLAVSIEPDLRRLSPGGRGAGDARRKFRRFF